MTEEQVRSAVIEGWLETGQGLSAEDIAQRIGGNAASVRRMMAKSHGCIKGLIAGEDWRPSYSKSYTHIQTGSHKVWVYRPTGDTLRIMIQELRQQVSK